MLTKQQIRNRKDFQNQINEDIENKIYVPFLDIKKTILSSAMFREDIRHIETLIGEKIPDMGFIE